MSVYLRDLCVNMLNGHSIQAYPVAEYDVTSKVMLVTYVYFCSHCGCDREEIYGQGFKRSRPPAKKGEPKSQSDLSLKLEE